ncbi:MAG: peptidoglycan DD-metalloendopeptidase family protein [Muribaculaceae bacterium]|nr:peptidoglycan DD-metalloendopeptidase family protein [Muribaculaceae bacterium]
MISRLNQSIIVILFLFVSGVAMAQSSSGIKREQRRNRQQMEQAQRNVRQNEQAVENNLRQLDLFDGQITDISRDVRRLKGTSDSLRQLIRPLNDSIKELNSRLAAMSEKYSAALRKSQTNGNSMNDITFVFSSESFMQAWQRYRSLRQFARWRQRKAAEIVDTRASLQSRQQRLDSLKTSNNRVLSRVEQQRNTLERKRVETDRLVTSLKSQNKQLQQVLKRRQKEAEELERKLEQALAEEMEKQRREEEARQRRLKEQQAAEQTKSEQATTTTQEKQQPVQTKPAQPSANSQLTGSFESNKGKLPYPLSGEYTIVKKFGRQKHPRLPKVETNNPGIDIEASQQGAAVHAVFDGEVSQIFKLAGYNNVIVLRHGDYVTVYANIAGLNVKKGDKVKTGQVLGSLYVDKADGNRSVLHFELRREKEKENPELWLRR